MRRLALAVLALLALGLPACGPGDSPTWDGPPAPDAQGVVPVDEFVAYQDDVDEHWEGSAVMTASEFLRLDERTSASVRVVSSGGPEGGGDQTVVVTLDGLGDDSVRAERWTLELTEADGRYTLASARRDVRCQAGRGHADFAPDPCV